MQYLLTEDEYKNLVPSKDYHSARRALVAAADWILEIKSFACIHDSDDEDKYCDGCPIVRFSYNVANELCTKEKRFSP